MVRARYEMPKNRCLETDFDEQLMISVVGTAMGRHADGKV